MIDFLFGRLLYWHITVLLNFCSIFIVLLPYHWRGGNCYYPYSWRVLFGIQVRLSYTCACRRNCGHYWCELLYYHGFILTNFSKFSWIFQFCPFDDRARPSCWVRLCLWGLFLTLNWSTFQRLRNYWYFDKRDPDYWELSCDCHNFLISCSMWEHRWTDDYWRSSFHIPIGR